MTIVTGDAVCDSVQTALRCSPVAALRKLRVDRSNGRLMILGRVSSYYHKQLAQEMVRTLAAGCTIENAVEVDEIVRVVDLD